MLGQAAHDAAQSRLNSHVRPERREHLIRIGGFEHQHGPRRVHDRGTAVLIGFPRELDLRGTLGGAIPGGHLVILGAILVIAALFLKRGVVGAVLAAMRRRGRA